MKKLLFIALAFFLHCTTYASERFSTLEERMSGEEFKQTGINKLTSGELAALNDWLRRHSVATLENSSVRQSSDTALPGSSEDLRGFKDQPKDDPNGNDNKLINGVIEGTFVGWNRKGGLFKLTNGMVWQQDEKDSFYTDPVENPEIIIKKGFMGKWHLSIVGHDSSVRVKRIQ